MKKIKKEKIITNEMQEVASDILTVFMFVNNMEDFNKVWDDIYKKYQLNEDPFVGIPCSNKTYAENSLEYDKQLMIARYGHCDGLD